jgi:flagellin FlaB
LIIDASKRGPLRNLEQEGQKTQARKEEDRCAKDRLYRDEKGVTGLETAIILIAFVVVASVFAYTVLSAGIFSSQRGQEAVYAGLQQARSSLELKGAVVAKDVDSDNQVDQVTFTLANAVSGEPVDLTVPTDSDSDGLADSGSNNVTVISYMDQSERVDNLAWTKSFIGKNDGDNLLESEEKAQITVYLTATSGLGTYTDFTIEVKPPNGSVLSIVRTTPAKIDSVMNLK